MKSFFSLMLVALIPVTLTAQDTSRLRVLSYNIHHAEGSDGKLDLDRIAAVILSARPDLVALQEVDQNVKRSQIIDQPAELAKKTGMAVRFGKNIELQGGHYGNVILSKFPIESHQNSWLPLLGPGEQRGVLQIEFLWPHHRAGRIAFWCTHLDHRADDAERLASAEKLNQLATNQAQLPILLAGDLNATRQSKVLARLQQEWTIAGTDDQPTIPVNEPKRQIDFVLFRPASAWKLVESAVLSEAVASDHRAILVVLESK